jgi:hypothetical protein
MTSALSRARPKELVHDYLDREVTAAPGAKTEAQDAGRDMEDIDARQQQAAERWAERQRARAQGLAPEAGHGQVHGIEGVAHGSSKLQDHSLGGAEEDFGL